MAESFWGSCFYLFPFDRVDKGSSVVLLGGGEVGKQFVTQILANHWCNIEAIIDNKLGADRVRYSGIKIFSACNYRYDNSKNYIISTVNEVFQREFITTLKEAGISEEKIVVPNIKNCIIPCTYPVFHSECDENFVHKYRDEIYSIHNILKVYSSDDYQMVRIGNLNDGGYLMLDDFSNPNIAYSFGIGHDVGWDKQMIDYGYQCYMYDHTIEKLPYENDRFHFFKIGIADTQNHAANLDSLENLLSMNHHDHFENMILKLDVEGAEWGFIEQVSENTLLKFRQIIFEFHNLCDFKEITKKIQCLKKINQTHAILHLHPNNFGTVYWIHDKPFPDVLEVTYVNRYYYSVKEMHNIRLPAKEDAPCCQYYGEINLGDWNEENYYHV